MQTGRNVNIEPRVNFIRMSQTSIGDNSGIGYGSFVGLTTIGKDVMMADEVMIISGNHHFDRTDIPMRLQGGEDQRVVIEDDVWIGARVIILPGRRIGKGSILGAGSVITCDVEPYSVMGGNPARLIRRRSPV
ncbi:MAG TPA: acyltransferase [Desulfobacteraceae bacterium]|nr:acyltransferase [Desulfobacteraceae bacterium]